MASACGPIRLAASDCLTARGNAEETLAALLRGDRALQLTSVLGTEGGDAVPMALLSGRSLDEVNPPAWLPSIAALLGPVSDVPWGSARHPVLVASSNFGVGSLYAARRGGDARHAAHGTPGSSVDLIRRQLGWGENIAVFSHACVSAHIAMLEASRRVAAGVADSALVFAYDFLSPFVAGGFHALKILNADFPTPYQDRPTGSIGLGDGAAYAVITRDRGDFAIAGQSIHNELHHFTSNKPDGSGFAAVLAPIIAAAAGRRVWLKGHGTGTLEAGRLEATALTTAFGDAPLVGWKGSLGHTLGSCGLVELAIVIAALRSGRTPGTVGSRGPTFTGNVALNAFNNSAYDSVVCASNAFGGAHAVLLLTHA